MLSGSRRSSSTAGPAAPSGKPHTPRAARLSTPISKLTMHSDGAASAVVDRILSRAPAERVSDRESFLGAIAAMRNTTHVQSAKTLPDTRIPEGYWIFDEDEAVLPLWAKQDTADSPRCNKPGRVLPSSAPSGRADVYFLANVVDDMLDRVLSGRSLKDGSARCADEPPEATQRGVIDVLMLAMTELARQCGATVGERGVFVDRLRLAMADVLDNVCDIASNLRKELDIARGYDPAVQFEDVHRQLFRKDVEVLSLRNKMRHMEEELKDLRERAAGADMLRKARDDLAAFVSRQAARTAEMLEIEEELMAAEKANVAAAAAAAAAAVDGESESDQGIDEPLLIDRAVQAVLDAPFDATISNGVFGLVEDMMVEMKVVEQLVAPFYSTAGLQDLTKPATHALAKLSDLTKKALHESKNEVSIRAGGMPSLTREMVASLISACREATKQVRLRIAAIADRNDIRKLAFPLKPPDDARTPCELCSRTEVDPKILEAAREFDRSVAIQNQMQRSIDLLQTERAALAEENSQLAARLARRTEGLIDACVLTDPIAFDDGSPPLQLNLIIGSVPAKAPTKAASARPGAKSLWAKAAKAAGGAGTTLEVPDDGTAVTAATPRRKTVSSVSMISGTPQGDAGLAVDPPMPADTPAALKFAVKALRGAGSRSRRASSNPLGASSRRKSTTSPEQPKPTVRTVSPTTLHAPSIGDQSVEDASLKSRSASALRAAFLSESTLQRVSVGGQPNSLSGEEEVQSPLVPQPTAPPLTYSQIIAGSALMSRSTAAMLKPKSWLLKQISATMAAKAKADAQCIREQKPLLTCGEHLLEMLKATVGSRKLIVDAVLSVQMSAARFSPDDQRVALFDACLSEQYNTNVYATVVRVVRALDESVSFFSPGKEAGDTGKTPAHVALVHALSALATTLDHDAAYDLLCEAAVNRSFVTPEPCRAAAITEFAGSFKRKLPEDAAYRKLVRCQLLRVVAELASGTRPDPALFDTLEVPIPTGSALWRSDDGLQDDA